MRRVCEAIPLGGVQALVHIVRFALFWRAAVRQATCASARLSHSELVKADIAPMPVSLALLSPSTIGTETRRLAFA